MDKEEKFREHKPYSLLILVFFVSLSSMGLELTITRIFSLIFAYYYLFLAVSIALCGFGLGGFFASLLDLRAIHLKSISVILAISYITALILPLKVTFFLSHPLILATVFIFPFLFTGMIIAQVYRIYYRFSGYVYSVDMVGAATGTLSIIGLLSLFSPINVIFLLATGILLSTFIAFRRLPILILLLLSASVLFFNHNHRLVDIPYRHIPTSYYTKALISLLRDGGADVQIERTYWSPSFRTDVVFTTMEPNTRGIFIDGSAPTIMFQYSGDLTSIKWLKNTLNYIPFSVVHPDDVLCIGSGGGLDVLLALLADFKKIEAVDINECMPRIIKDYKYFIDGLFENERVDFISCDGRNYLKRTKNTYDLIYLACAQTKTSSKVGLPLVESYIHTTDAYVDYLRHLKPEGMVALLCETPSFLQRTVFNIIHALLQLGIPVCQSKNHIIIIDNSILNSPYKHLLILKKTPFSRDQINLVCNQANKYGYFSHHFPYILESQNVSFSSLKDIRASLKATRTKQGIDLSPTTDEKPLFYDLSTGAPSFLYWLCVFTVILAVLMFLVVRRRVGTPIPIAMMLLGAGFMLIEVALTQKFLFFLGRPLTTFSVTLVGLLSGSGIGGYMSQKMKYPLKKLSHFLTCLIILILLFFFFLTSAFARAFILTEFSRCLVSYVMLFTLGFFMGIPFPIFIRIAGDISKRDIGYLWGINGLMAVFGSSFSIIISKIWGIKYSLLVACFLYISVLIIHIMSRKE